MALALVIKLGSGLFFDAVFAIEALNASGSIDQSLLTRVERMTIRANFDLYSRQRRTCLKSIAACASHYASAVVGMNFSFHFKLSALADKGSITTPCPIHNCRPIDNSVEKTFQRRPFRLQSRLSRINQ
jgi:hypothetical protein